LSLFFCESFAFWWLRVKFLSFSFPVLGQINYENLKNLVTTPSKTGLFSFNLVLEDGVCSKPAEVMLQNIAIICGEITVSGVI
jgi:hypothetical protein